MLVFLSVIENIVVLCPSVFVAHVLVALIKNERQAFNQMKDRLLWDEITSDSANPLHEFLPAQRARSLRKRGHNYILPPVRTERFKRCFFNNVFLNLCSYLVLYICRKL